MSATWVLIIVLHFSQFGGSYAMRYDAGRAITSIPMLTRDACVHGMSYWAEAYCIDQVTGDLIKP